MKNYMLTENFYKKARLRAVLYVIIGTFLPFNILFIINRFFLFETKEYEQVLSDFLSLNLFLLVISVLFALLVPNQVVKNLRKKFNKYQIGIGVDNISINTDLKYTTILFSDIISVFEVGNQGLRIKYNNKIEFVSAEITNYEDFKSELSKIIPIQRSKSYLMSYLIGAILFCLTIILIDIFAVRWGGNINTYKIVKYVLLAICVIGLIISRTRHN